MKKAAKPVKSAPLRQEKPAKKPAPKAAKKPEKKADNNSNKKI
jgi:hypothetical protein